jgi:hypothetical protein
MLCGVLVTVATPTALLLGVLLAPGLLAMALDRGFGRPAARTMLLFGLSAVVFPMIALWKGGHTIELATGLALDAETLAWAWAAAATGWLLTQLLPLFIRLGMEGAAMSRKLRVKNLRARCAEEWGLPDPAG